MALEHSKNTVKNAFFENTGLENQQKSVVFAYAGLEGPEGAGNAENMQKQVFSRCGAFRRPRCDVEKARKNMCFRPQGSEKTRKNAVFFEGPRRKHSKTSALGRLCRKHAKTSVFGFSAPRPGRPK